MDKSVVAWHRRSVERFAELTRGVGDDQWAMPTPCTEWDVRALVNHLVYEERWTVPLMAGSTIADVGDRFEGDLLGDDPGGATAAAGQEAIAAVAEPGAVERTVHLSFGDVPGEEYAWQLFTDHLIHGWDLAVATGQDDRLDPELVTACADWFADREHLYRAGGSISARAEMPANADPQTRLIAAFGRDPGWKPAI
jgi:uncharacterized protein (TIGR03086 family)